MHRERGRMVFANHRLLSGDQSPKARRVGEIDECTGVAALPEIIHVQVGFVRSEGRGGCSFCGANESVGC